MKTEIEFLEQIKNEFATAEYGEGISFNLNGIAGTINDRIKQVKKLNKANVIKSLPTDNEKFRRWKKKHFYEDAGGFTEYKNMKKRPPETTLQDLYDEWLLTD